MLLRTETVTATPVKLRINEDGGGEAEISLDGRMLRVLIQEGEGYHLISGRPIQARLSLSVEELASVVSKDDLVLRSMHGPLPRCLNKIEKGFLNVDFAGVVEDIVWVRHDRQDGVIDIAFDIDCSVKIPAGMSVPAGQTIAVDDWIQGRGILRLSYLLH